MSILKNCTRYLLVGMCGCCAVAALSGTGLAEAQRNGEADFKTYCAACHYEGGNLIKPEKTLSKADREKNGIRTAQDIIKLVRKPGEGMTVFDEKTLPDAQARGIAEYIISTY